MKSQEHIREITKEQLEEGYVALVNGIIIRHSYHIIRKLSDGTYLVAEPKIEDLT